MQRAFQSTRGKLSSIPKTATVETTLYDLIRVVNEEIPPGEAYLVSSVVAYMLYNGKTVLRLHE